MEKALRHQVKSRISRARDTLDGHPEVKQRRAIYTYVFVRLWLTQSSQATPFTVYETRLSLYGVPLPPWIHGCKPVSLWGGGSFLNTPQVSASSIPPYNAAYGIRLLHLIRIPPYGWQNYLLTLGQKFWLDTPRNLQANIWRYSSVSILDTE